MGWMIWRKVKGSSGRGGEEEDGLLDRACKGYVLEFAQNWFNATLWPPDATRHCRVSTILQVP
jgi:hypothetical protein